jgi:hypothetical protein
LRQAITAKATAINPVTKSDLIVFSPMIEYPRQTLRISRTVTVGTTTATTEWIVRMKWRKIELMCGLKAQSCYKDPYEKLPGRILGGLRAKTAARFPCD